MKKILSHICLIAIFVSACQPPPKSTSTPASAAKPAAPAAVTPPVEVTATRSFTEAVGTAVVQTVEAAVAATGTASAYHEPDAAADPKHLCSNYSNTVPPANIAAKWYWRFVLNFFITNTVQPGFLGCIELRSLSFKTTFWSEPITCTLKVPEVGGGVPELPNNLRFSTVPIPSEGPYNRESGKNDWIFDAIDPNLLKESPWYESLPDEFRGPLATQLPAMFPFPIRTPTPNSIELAPENTPVSPADGHAPPKQSQPAGPKLQIDQPEKIPNKPIAQFTFSGKEYLKCPINVSQTIKNYLAYRNDMRTKTGDELWGYNRIEPPTITNTHVYSYFTISAVTNLTSTEKQYTGTVVQYRPDVPSEIDCNQQQYCNPSGLKIESPGKLKIQFQPTFNGRLYAPGDDAYSAIEFDPNNLQGWRITLREQLKDSTIESQTQRSEFRVVIEHDQVVDHTPSHSEFYRHRTTSFSRAFPLGSESSPAPFELWEGPAIIYIGGDGTEESFNGGLNQIIVDPGSTGSPDSG